MGTNIITPKFIERMRSSDYQGTSYAFAEIVDNSFDAEATEVKIISIEKRDARNRRYIDEILFSDNGTGMDDVTLNHCLTFAFGTNDNIDEIVIKKKIGKFGMGLPNASISQCKKIEVFSKTPNTTWRSKRLDIQELKDKDATELDDIEETSLPSYYEQVKAIIDKEKGTIVSWKECDRLDRQFAKTLYERAESILGRVFRYHLAKGLKIILEIYEFNETENTYNATFSPKHIVLNDPLFLTPNSYITRFLWQESRRDESIEEKRDPATYYSKFILGLSQEESLPTNIKNEDHSYIHRFEWKNKE